MARKIDKDHNKRINVVETDPLPGEEIRSLLERWEAAEAHKAEFAKEQKEVMAEAKGRGYDTKILRKLLAERKRDRDDVAEEEAILQLYRDALGMSYGSTRHGGVDADVI